MKRMRFYLETSVWNFFISEEISDKYLATKRFFEEIRLKNYRNDALHIAYVSFYELDAVISWNLRHIVKMKTRRLVNYINLLEGYRPVELVTPEEVIEDER